MFNATMKTITIERGIDGTEKGRKRPAFLTAGSRGILSPYAPETTWSILLTTATGAERKEADQTERKRSAEE